MALISDILRGPYGDPQPNVIITMRAKETSARVLVSNSSAAITAADGKYSMQVFPGEYEVLVSTLGKVGEIRVYPDSKDGTLNDFLITPGEDELTPKIVQSVETMRVEAAKSAAAAKVSEKNAAETLAGAMKKGDFGFGGSGAVKSFADDAAFRAFLRSRDTGSQIIRVNTVSSITKIYAPALVMKASDTWLVLSATNVTGTGIERHGVRIAVGSENGGSDTEFELWTNQNTTTDSNGFIKKASPIVKLFRDGTSELNNESQGVTTEHVSEGVYRVSGTLGFNADAQWGGPDGGIEVPLDRNKQPLIWVDYEVEPTGDLLIKTYHRTHPAAPAFARNDILGYDEGMLIDIPEGRWVDLRVEMPAVDAPGTEEEATA
ncbi:tail fiber protein [Aeromonas phage pAEv1818]|uniref:tail fiber protein n=1 Tax=Aeromonas phage pAEv1818 TaxID=2908746 RepID=UPI0023297ECC|nr:tail fiber protein [Aeromonas phage pAEv1818]UIS24894.1 tail fiber protein [Aeromonas phage pAEv1818]